MSVFRVVVRGYTADVVSEEIEAPSMMAAVNAVLDKYRPEFDEIELETASDMSQVASSDPDEEN